MGGPRNKQESCGVGKDTTFKDKKKAEMQAAERAGRRPLLPACAWSSKGKDNRKSEQKEKRKGQNSTNGESVLSNRKMSSLRGDEQKQDKVSGHSQFKVNNKA